MKPKGYQYSYGPVPSRRLGKSMGINNIPGKVCTYSCVYCQVGRTTKMQIDRCSFYKPEDIFQDVQSRLIKTNMAKEQVDYLTFVPDGEPTLDVNLGREITLLKALNVPIGVITNCSLLWREDVREELGKADWVSLKIDAVQEVIWRYINRPHKAISLSLILDGILAFAKSFNGKLVTETMLVNGINDTDGCVIEIADFIQRFEPSQAYLSIPTRPPAEKRVHSPNEKALNRAYQIFADRLNTVEYLIGYEGNAFAFTDDIEKDILNITTVHPMRKEAVDAILSRAGCSWDIIDRMITRGVLTKAKYNEHIFYLSKYNKRSEVPFIVDPTREGNK